MMTREICDECAGLGLEECLMCSGNCVIYYDGGSIICKYCKGTGNSVHKCKLCGGIGYWEYSD